MKTHGLSGTNTLTGLNFESKVDFQTLLEEIPGYSLAKISDKAGMEVFFEEKLVARYFKKHDFYRFLDESKVNWQNMLSKKLLPDDVMLVIVRKTLFIIEVEYQQIAGDEELMLCDFKRKQYLKLVAPLGLKVEYVYVLNDWFKKPEYKDVLITYTVLIVTTNLMNCLLHGLGYLQRRSNQSLQLTASTPQLSFIVRHLIGRCPRFPRFPHILECVATIDEES